MTGCEWPGTYLGKVFQTRPVDPWVRVQVPQVLGTGVTNWARPAGFSTGPPPGEGSLVLVVFLGGDINRPAYLLTSQQTG